MNEWFNRSKKYADLKWTKNKDLLEVIKKECKLNKNIALCDVGTGTGLVAGYLQPFCKSVTAIDTSTDMLARAKYNYKNKIFCHLVDAEKMTLPDTFDCVVSRMCFHHISNPQRAMNKCYQILKKNGRMVICEAIPPIGSYAFYKEFFNFKEVRHLFRAGDIINLFKAADFKNINYRLFVMKQVSIRNWVSNNNLTHDVQKLLFDMWKDAPPYIKKAHNLKCSNGDILVDWLFIIVSGVKK